MGIEVDTGHGSYKLPNAMTVAELLSEGKTLEQADHIMKERVFGVDFPKDEKGNPVERGKGSNLQPTSQHVEALRVANERDARSTGNVSSLDANALAKAVVAAVQASNGGGSATADVIAAAVAAGVKAGLAAAKEDSPSEF